jgi:peptidyl-tRNA hydrolase, PTH1 family
MKIIVGLGNPELKYKDTRHNTGFMVLDELKNEVVANFSSVNFKNMVKFKAEILKINEMLLVKPQTFMNRSGMAVKKIVDFYNLKDLNSLIVVHDDLDIKLGEYKIQFGKGPKQHNGLDSIEKNLKTIDFWRVRVGIDNRKEDSAVAGQDYVLQKFSSQEKTTLKQAIPQIIADLLNWIKNAGR